MDPRDVTTTKQEASRGEEREGEEERDRKGGKTISWPPSSALRRYERDGKTFRFLFLVNDAEV